MTDAVPPWLATMRQITGTNAVNDNTVIVGWATKIGALFPEMASYCAQYTHDTIAWCGLTVGYCMASNGIRPVFGATDTDKFLYALAWKQFGTPVSAPQFGDVLVFDFGGGDHHVTLYEQTQNGTYVCRGGNQSNQVKLSNYSISQCIGIYRPPAASISVPVVASPPLAVQMFSGITATVFGGAADPNTSAYDGHLIDDVELGVALPYHFPGVRPNVCVWNAGKSVVCKIVDVGPWNTNDPYWQTGTRPEAESGTDTSGRKTNGAGIDLTPGAARAIGIQGKGTVDWEFTDSSQPGPPPVAIPTTPPAPTTPTKTVPALSGVQQLIKLLEAIMAGTTTTTTASTTATQTNLASLIPQILALVQALTPQSTQSGTPTPGLTQAQLQQAINILNAAISSPTGQQILGQVNGALGQKIGNLLNGKKTAIGIIGSLLTGVLQNAGAAGALPSALSSLMSAQGATTLGGIAMPIFLAITAWGTLGKLEKWAQAIQSSKQ